jgi:protoheme IX farnesyltransferase
MQLTQAVPERPAAPASVAAARGREKAAAYLELTKPGITRLVLVTTAAGFWLASPELPSLARLAHALVGTGLAAAGTNALNAVWEAEIDARMGRTRNRPIPSGRLGVREALVFATACAVVGIVYLLLMVNAVTAVVVGATVASYVLVYTPLKRRTWLSTLIGAVPGALPIVAGWTAAGGEVTAAAWALFAILFLWQMPHFFALAWIYRDDYRRGGLRMLSVLDPDGRRTGRHVFGWLLLLVAASTLPTLLGVSGYLYLGGALLLGAAFLVPGVAVLRRTSLPAARRVFMASIAYLPALLFLMIVDKVA